MRPFPTARDTSLSLWQSATHEVARRRALAPRGASLRELADIHGPDGPADADDPMVQATSAYIAGIETDEAPAVPRTADIAESFDMAIELEADAPRSLSPAEQSALYHQLAEARATGNRVKERAAISSLRQFGPLDVGWMASVAQYVYYYKLRGRQPAYRSWKTAGDGSLDYSVVDWKIPADGTVAIISDWATGQPDAISVLRSVAAMEPDAIIHLGDIYYSGTEKECIHHVLQPVLQFAVNRHGERIPFFSLAGNHEYYSGGEAFYRLLDEINAYDPGLHQPASFFSLTSADGAWQFLAMDTGYNDHDMIGNAAHHGFAAYLREDEIEWHRHRMETFGGATILLSHHQLCSAYDAIGSPKSPADPSYSPRLLAPFAPWLDRIPAWFWGHEHSLVLFEPFGTVLHPRCVGHSGIPVSSESSIYDRRYNVPFERTRLSSHGDWYDRGFELLRLGGWGKPIVVEYYAVRSGGDPSHPILLHGEKIEWPRAIG